MSNLILQPTSNKLAAEHFVSTIENYVHISEFEPYVTETFFQTLKEFYPDGHVRVWGVISGKNNCNQKKWEKVKKGDIVLFSKKGGVFALGVITATLHNSRLAKYLWQKDGEEQAWECMYFVKNIKKTDMPYEKVNPLLGYKSNFVIQGFTVLDEEKSKAIVEMLRLEEL